MNYLERKRLNESRRESRGEKDLFPEMPPYKAKWWPIYMSPIRGSGERICVFITATGESGEWFVYQSMKKVVIDAAYGEAGAGFQMTLDWLFQSLKYHIKKFGSLDDWEPPFHSVYKGEMRPAADFNIYGVINQGIRMCASFAELIKESEPQGPAGRGE